MNSLRSFLTFAVLCITHVLFSQDSEIGWANYYSDYFHGRQTAYGEQYDRNQFTCAHKTYPAGTLLRITRLDNRSSVVVRVNDKGPHTEGFLITLSLGGAQSIGLDKSGKARVLVEPVGYTQTNQPTTNNYAASAPSSYDFTPRGSYTSAVPNTTYPAYVEQNTNTAYNPAMPSSTTLLPKSNTPAPSAQTFVKTVPETAPTSYSTYNQPIPSGYDQRTETFTPRGITQPEMPATTAVAFVFTVQLGAYGNLVNAERQVLALRNMGLANISILMPKTGQSALYRIITGNFPVRLEAETYQRALLRDFRLSGFVLQL